MDAVQDDWNPDALSASRGGIANGDGGARATIYLPGMIELAEGNMDWDGWSMARVIIMLNPGGHYVYPGGLIRVYQVNKRPAFTEACAVDERLIPRIAQFHWAIAPITNKSTNCGVSNNIDISTWSAWLSAPSLKRSSTVYKPVMAPIHRVAVIQWHIKVSSRL